MRRKEIFKKSAFRTLQAGIAPILLTLAIMVAIMYGLHQTELSSRSEAVRILEEAILRSSIKCYAIEGSYPESIEYIEENYGVHIDRTKYAVFYEVFASNFLPNITVIDLRGL